MSEPMTSGSGLFARVRESSDDEAWQAFAQVYQPLIRNYGLRHGLQEADADDLSQSVLTTIVSVVRHFVFDSTRGSFRRWLLTVTRNEMYKHFNRQKRFPVGSGDTGVHQALDQRPGVADADDPAWDREYQERIFTWATEQARHDFEETTWQAFWLTAVKLRPPSEAAEELKMTLGAVYTAKSRVLGRIRQLIQDAEIG